MLGGVCALLAADWRVMGAFSVCAPYIRSGRGWLAVDGGRSQHYFDGLDCGLPLVAFWQHNANAKCWRVHACTCSVPSFYLSLYR